jgi:hypothetical protein
VHHDRGLGVHLLETHATGLAPSAVAVQHEHALVV